MYSKYIFQFLITTQSSQYIYSTCSSIEVLYMHRHSNSPDFSMSLPKIGLCRTGSSCNFCFSVSRLLKVTWVVTYYFKIKITIF